MKLAKSPMTLLLAVGVFFVAGASQTAHARDQKSSSQSNEIFATSAVDGGRLYIQRSPVLPYNISIVLTIDGKVAGTSVRHRNFDRYITPGRHVLVASPNRLRGDWSGILDVRAGETYTYVASYNVNKLVLERVKTTPR